MEGGEPLDAWDAGAGFGLGFGEFCPLPDGDGVVGLTEEEDFPVIWVMGGGAEEEDGVFLGDAGEVEEVAVLLKREGGVCVGGVGVV